MGIEATFEPGRTTAKRFFPEPWWVRPLPRRTVLVVLALVPLLTPLVSPGDDGPFIYPYCVAMQLLGAWFCWKGSLLYPAEKVRWQLVIFSKCVHALPYAIASAGYFMPIVSNGGAWLANACVAAYVVLFLPALMGVRSVRGKWVRALDYMLAAQAGVLLMRALGSGASPGNSFSRITVSLLALVFVTWAAFVARSASSGRDARLFSSVIALYLSSCLIVCFLLNFVNLYWLPHQNILASDMLVAFPELILCEAIMSWKPRLSSEGSGADPVLIDSLQPSIMVFGGVLLALYGLRMHPAWAAMAIVVLVFCYALRTHLFYHSLFAQQKELRTQAALMQNLATRDALTGVGNRRWFDEEVETLLAAGRTYPCSMLLVDTDNFKDINDNFGHPIGDEVLRTVAAVLSEVTAQVKRGCCARIGGDEFGALWPATDAEQAMVLAETIRARVEAKTFLAPFSATVSLGLATAQNALPTLKLMRWADGALYQAKAAGRNRIHTIDLGKLQE